jgi:glycosyltransferase involved in cell wall biosynthesis
MRVAHVTVIHPPSDARIVLKECRSLAAAGHDVHLLAPGAPAEVVEGVTGHGLPWPARGWHFRKVLPRLPEVYRRASALQADVYHLHDPHLIPVGLALKRAGAVVVYDSHEDSPKQAISVAARSPLKGRAKRQTWRLLEWRAERRFDAFVAATPAIARRFPPARTVVIHNFALLEEFAVPSLDGELIPHCARECRVVYAGGITPARGIREIVDMIELLSPDLRAALVLLGDIRRPALDAELRAKPGWARVDYLGFRPRGEMVEELSRARVGLALLHPMPNHLEAMPNKFWEYMAAGLPIVASDFPFWRELFGRIGCGLLVDPLDPRAIADAVDYLLRNPVEAEAMGRRGRAAVEAEFNWGAEGDRLVSLYENLAARAPAGG